MTKKPIVLKNVRLSYPDIRSTPDEEISLMRPRGPNFTVTIPSRWGPFTLAWMASAFMGRTPPVRGIVGYDPQKLLPAPSATNRPMSLWSKETLMEMIGDIYPNNFESMFPKPAKPERFYIAGGHFDMLPPGTFDPDEEAIMFDKGSPTGRRLTPFITPRWGESNNSPFDDIARFRREMTEPWPHKVAVVKIADLDFGAVEARILAAMADKRVRGVFIDIETAYGEIVGNPQLDLYRQAFMHAPVEKKVAKKAPPAYLQHDPTKRHKRRRKGK